MTCDLVSMSTCKIHCVHNNGLSDISCYCLNRKFIDNLVSNAVPRKVQAMFACLENVNFVCPHNIHSIQTWIWMVIKINKLILIMLLLVVHTVDDISILAAFLLCVCVCVCLCVRTEQYRISSIRRPPSNSSPLQIVALCSTDWEK